MIEFLCKRIIEFQCFLYIMHVFSKNIQFGQIKGAFVTPGLVEVVVCVCEGGGDYSDFCMRHRLGLYLGV